VAYLRTISSRRERERACRCARCGNVVFRFEAHCPFCGEPSASFDAALYARIARCSIAEAVVACTRTVAHAAEAQASEGGRALFCPDCGVRLGTDRGTR
jgi:hypothetical protein